VKGKDMFDKMDITDEADQKKVLRKLGEMIANTITQSPADFACLAELPIEILEWLEDNSAYLLIEVRIDGQ
jgi:hypothetical protein